MAQSTAGFGAMHNTYCPRNHSLTDNSIIQEMKELSSLWASGALLELRLRLSVIEYSDIWPGSHELKDQRIQKGRPLQLYGVYSILNICATTPIHVGTLVSYTKDFGPPDHDSTLPRSRMILFL